MIAEEKKYQNIQLDWSKYVDEDDEAEEGGKGVGGGDWDPEMMNSKFIYINYMPLLIFLFFIFPIYESFLKIYFL